MVAPAIDVVTVRGFKNTRAIPELRDLSRREETNGAKNEIKNYELMKLRIMAKMARMARKIQKDSQSTMKGH